MRIIVSGGGTGGHIYPALTIVRAIQKKRPEAEFLYVGTKDGLEADIVPKEGLPFATVNIQGFKRSLTPENFLRGAQAFGGVMKAMGVVRRFHPDVAIGTGGYVCGPILLAASLMGVPTLIQEQNVMPGVTNRLLARFVSCIAMGTKGFRMKSTAPERNTSVSSFMSTSAVSMITGTFFISSLCFMSFRTSSPLRPGIL